MNNLHNILYGYLLGQMELLILVEIKISYGAKWRILRSTYVFFSFEAGAEMKLNFCKIRSWRVYISGGP